MKTELTKQHLSTRIFRSYLAYLRQNYPKVDLGKISADVGLPLSYIEDENNWVSVSFAEKFTRLCIEESGHKDLGFEVGRFATSEEMIGPVIYRLVKYGMRLQGAYKNIANFGRRFNKLIKFSIVSQSYGTLTIRLTPLLEHLDPQEIAAFYENYPSLIKNTQGYFSGVPVIYGQAPARVSMSEIIHPDAPSEFDFVIHFTPHWQWVERISFGLIATIIAIVGAYSSSRFSVNNYASFFVISFFLATSGLAWLFSKYGQLKKALRNTDTTLQQLDDSYLALQKTKESLERRFQEAQLIHLVSDNLTKAQSGADVIEQSCNDIVGTLRYDRVLILVADDAGQTLTYGASKGADPITEKLFRSYSQQVEIGSDDPKKISNVYKTGASVLIEDVDHHIRTLNEESRSLLTVTQSRSFLAVPIASDQRKYGVMCVDYIQAHKSLTPGDLVLMESIARQIALALDKETAQEQTVQALREGNEVKTQLLSSYSRFVPFKFVELLGHRSITEVSLGDHTERDMAVMFSDIRGFTTFSEKLSPMKTFEFLNSYYEVLAPIVISHQGVIDKYVGDGCMAFFPGEGSQALAATIEIIRQLRGKRNEWKAKYGFDVITGIGMTTGRLILGTIGYDKQMQGTVISDVVNTASRLENLTKDFGASLIVSEELLKAAGARDVTFIRHLGDVRVRGRSNKVRICEVFEGDRDEQKHLKAITKSDFERALQCLSEGSLGEAEALLKNILDQNPEDHAAMHYLNQIRPVSFNSKAA